MNDIRICLNCNRNFTIEPDDFAFYEKIKVPPPAWCPECRFIRRLAWRNERTLYKRACDLCGESTFSMYPQKTTFPVYCRDCWLSDTWDPLEYGKLYDPNKAFLTQWNELFLRVPRIALVHYGTNVECNFANYIKDSKRVALAFSVVNCENVCYSSNIDYSTDIFDCSNVSNCQRCFFCMNCDHCSGSQYLLQCRECIDSLFLYDCINCQNCFMSSNLRNKRYVWRGEQLTKEEYQERIKNLENNSHTSVEKLRKEFTELCASSVHKFADLYKTIDSTGDAIGNTKNAKNTFYASNMENTNFIIRSFHTKDSYDVYGAGEGNQLLYDGVTGGHNSSNLKFFAYAHNTSNSEYTFWCQNSSKCFGSVGLRNKKYCILNVQYSEKEYDELREKIIRDMGTSYGEFFPPDFAPFAYNECIAQEFYPMTEQSTHSQGFLWGEKDEKSYRSTIQPSSIPESIVDVQNDIVNEVIACEHFGIGCNHGCTTAFKILSSELEFYRLLKIPLPHVCPNCRHYDRLELRNPLKLWNRQCMKEGCTNKFETSYAPDRKEIIFCETCYQQEVV